MEADNAEHCDGPKSVDVRAVGGARSESGVRVVVRSASHAMTIKLNGDPHDLQGPLSVSSLLERLAIA